MGLGQPGCGSGSAAMADAYQRAVSASLALSSVTTQYSDPIDVSGFAWIDFVAALSTPGAPTLTGVIFSPQWSIVEAPTVLGDWSPVFREEFNVGAAPTGNGQATESTYSTLISVSTGELPTRKAGITVRTRGLWMRVGIISSGAVANINAVLYALRRTV